GCLTFIGVPQAFGQEDAPIVTQVVALDECDSVSFDAALGPGFSENVTLGAFTTLSDLFAKAAAGTPDPAGTSNPILSRSKKAPF
ncbi:MAG TPA: hypothetical protein VM781_00680, partial [Candidatus Bathyarchaeia archaeon]|nr:hypothetical protein [Candidatus Bathyarchaeia archaeon]